LKQLEEAKTIPETLKIIIEDKDSMSINEIGRSLRKVMQLFSQLHNIDKQEHDQ